MDKPMIGIRQADGSFYEIMDDAHGSRKRLVLSAARTDQHSVKIELFRSTDGTMENAVALGTIALEDPDGLGFQDIEFRVDLDAEGLLDASAALPGHPPRTLSVDLTPFRDEPAVRSDADILADESLATADLDDLGDAFSAEADPEPMTLDFPETDEFDDLDEPTVRSDAEILADDLLATDDLDTLDLDSFSDTDTDAEPKPKPEPEGAPEDLGSLDDFSLDDLDDAPAAAVAPAAADSFDLDDLDAGFGDDPVTPAAPASGAEPEQWEKISLDDMEAMEFMDTGDEISRPKAPAAGAPSPMDEFRMDDDQPLELGDLDSDFGDLPDLGDLDSPPRTPQGGVKAEDSFDSLDQDFLGLDDFDEQRAQEPEPVAPRSAAKAPKAPHEKRAPRAPKPANDEDVPGGLDKTALLLSLSALSLLVLLILVLLFLNMIKAPVPPVIQPEVMGWKPATSLAAPGPSRTVADLGSADAPAFEAASILEVPEALRGARISMTLAAGDTVADAQRRFGPPAKVEGAVLSW